MTLLERIFGPSWRTSLTALITALMGFLTFFAGIQEQLGPAWQWIPESYRTKLMLWSAIAAAVSKFLEGVFAKDKKITGNGTPASPIKIAQDDGQNREIKADTAGFATPQTLVSMMMIFGSGLVTALVVIFMHGCIHEQAASNGRMPRYFVLPPVEIRDDIKIPEEPQLHPDANPFGHRVYLVSQ